MTLKDCGMARSELRPMRAVGWKARLRKKVRGYQYLQDQAQGFN